MQQSIQELAKQGNPLPMMINIFTKIDVGETFNLFGVC